MQNLPDGVLWLFGGTTLLAAWLLYSLLARTRYSSRLIRVVMVSALAWLLCQMGISLMGVYYEHITMRPPYIFLFGVLPMLFVILILFGIGRSRRAIDRLDLEALTMIHTVRMPVEVVLLILSLYHVMPREMTFEGLNYDILAGMTAPLVSQLVRRRGMSRNMRVLLIIWNIICLILLLQVVRLGFGSAPGPMQIMDFEQPSIAVLYFPFSWLPTFIVPLVLFSHLAALWRLRQP